MTRLLLATRRQRGKNEPNIWAAHFAVVAGRDRSAFEFETDRARFLGRGRTLRNAAAMQGRRRFRTRRAPCSIRSSACAAACASRPARARAVAFVTLVAETRDAALALAATLRSLEACEQVFDKASERAAAELRGSASTRVRLSALTRFVAPLLYSDAAWRSPPDVLERGSGGAPVLWAAASRAIGRSC